MNALELQTAYVARFATIPGVSTCEAHDQVYSDAELDRVGSGRTPSVRVIPMRALDDEDARHINDLMREWAFVAVVEAQAGDAKRLDLDSAGDVAWLIAQSIASILSSENEPRIGDCGARPIAELSNESRAGNARKGRTRWIVAWTEEAELATLEAAAEPQETLGGITTEFDTTGDDSPETTDEVLYS